jgi:transposase InsO family protein
MKYEAIDKLRGEHRVSKMARALNLSPQGYYQWRRRQQQRRIKQLEGAKLASRVREIFEKDGRKTFGYRKMLRVLAKKGIVLSEYRIRKIMQENGMYSVSGDKWRPIKHKKHSGRYLDNLLNQDFDVSKPNEVWAGDITYIKTKLGWVYLAVVIDLCSREVIGHAVSRKINAELVRRALANALILSGKKHRDSLIFHSDRGIQYASKSFQKMCVLHNITQSMSRPGCPYDNAPVESFFSSAKRENIYRKNYTGIDEVKSDLLDYIEVFYNRVRVQAGLGYLSPRQYRLSLENGSVV